MIIGVGTFPNILNIAKYNSNLRGCGAKMTCPLGDLTWNDPAPCCITEPFRTCYLKAPDGSVVYAPDGSIVRPLLAIPRQGGMAHFELLPGQISKAITHRTVSEIWYVISGEGRMWRKARNQEETVILTAGVCLTIPLGTHFQFRSDNSALNIVAATMPPWPGDSEAVEVEGHWNTTF